MSEPQISARDVLNASAGCLQKQMYVYFTLRPWLLNEGAVTMRITYSDGGREVI